MDFVKYAHRKKTLLRHYPGFLIYLAGGMAVKLYLLQLGVKPSEKVAKTKDFDFVFAVNHHLTDKEIEKYSYKMYKIMYNFLSGFTRMDKLRISSYKRTSHLSASGKRTYHVVQFKKQNGDDFVDCTLSYIPGFTRNQINSEASTRIGFPIKKLKPMSKDILTVLAGSFVYKFIKPRNPIGKDKPEKGLRNVARVRALRKLTSPKSVKTGEFLKAISNKKVTLATRKAKSILKNIAVIRKNANKLLQNSR